MKLPLWTKLLNGTGWSAEEEYLVVKLDYQNVWVESNTGMPDLQSAQESMSRCVAKEPTGKFEIRREVKLWRTIK